MSQDLDLNKLSKESVIELAKDEFIELEARFSGNSDNHYIFWDMLLQQIEDKLEHLELEDFDES